ncbi:MAG: hypothetical protein AB7H93_23520 [Vicinamibacterales bacterium]
MHTALLNRVIDTCRRRVREGDCPVTPACPVESLEDAVLTLAVEAREGLPIAVVQRVSAARSAGWHRGGVADWSLSDWATATAGELGEACNVVKKLNRVRDGIRGNTVDEAALRAQLAEELADTLLYLVLFAERAGIALDAAVMAKFNAVSEREGFEERL